MAFDKLFSGFSTERLTLNNRIVVLPYGTSMVRDGAITEEDIAHFENIARSGPGLIITGATVVHPSSAMRSRKLVEAYDVNALEMLSKRAKKIHQHDVKLFGQLVHLGREWIGQDSDYAPSAPSPLRSPRDPFPPHQLETSEIKVLVDAFGRSAYNLKQAGYDGVEIHGAHGYLVAQFLSPSTNHRTDSYGGTAEKRQRFLVEIIESIRHYCGENFGLSVRLSADEELLDGMEISDTVRVTESLSRLGMVDLLNITVGTRGGYVKDMSSPTAPAENAASWIRRSSGIPVIVGQRINTPELAERLLVEGAADLVGMARAFFADPEWIPKVKAGEAERIRPCLNVNQDCRAFSPHLHCAVNPQTGRETWQEFAALTATESPKKIAIIGGGPGGLEAALILALRGHRVSLFEASDGLGGQFLYASAIPNRSQLLRLVNFQISELRRLGVELRTGVEVTGPDDLGGHYDAVVLATGAKARPLDTAFQQPGVMSWFEVLEAGAPQVSGHSEAVFIEDGSGFWWNYGVVEALINAGWVVTIVTPSANIANQIPIESVAPLLARLGQGGTRFRILTTLEAVHKGAVSLLNNVTGEEEQFACDLLVIQTGREPVALQEVLFREGGVGEVYKIGDCITPRRVSFALFEAQKLARTM